MLFEKEKKEGVNIQKGKRFRAKTTYLDEKQDII